MTPDFHIHHRLSGRFTFRKGKVDGEGCPIPGTERIVADFNNLIVDNGLDSIYSCPGGSFSNEYLFTRCFVGTGSTAPAFTDASMDAFLAVSTGNENSTRSFVDHVTDPYWKCVKVFRFDAGVATGNLTEVGTGWGTSGTNLFSRALILDGGGSPTTITVLADEYVDVTYEFRNYIDVADFAATVTISSVAYDIPICRPSSIGSVPTIDKALASPNNTERLELRSTSTLGDVYSEPSGSATVDSNLSLSAYSDGDYFTDVTASFALDEGNFGGGIGSMVLELCQMKYQWNFSPKIPKTSSMIFSFTVRVSWSRYP